MALVSGSTVAGKFITIEGGDGTGKSTLLGRIEAHFRSQGLRFISTREPGGTPVADEIRALLLKPGRKLTGLAELFLFEAARADHVSETVRPALADGQHVLCDRFTHSTLAFQGYARGLGVELVGMLNGLATGGLEPDAVIWLRLNPTEARRRIAARGEKSRIDDEKHAFHEAVFNAFEAMAAKESARFIVLDASLPPDGVFEALLRHPRWIALFGSRG